MSVISYPQPNVYYLCINYLILLLLITVSKKTGLEHMIIRNSPVRKTFPIKTVQFLPFPRWQFIYFEKDGP